MDKFAFNTFISALRPKLYRFSLSLLKQHDAAEDVVQEVGLRLWRRVVQEKEHPHMEALAMCTAKNLCIDQLRRGSRPYGFAIDTAIALPVSERTPEHILEDKDAYAFLRRLVDQLPLQQQMCIRLRDIEGYEFEEIASILECDEGSVRTNLSRARKKIREQFVNQEYL